MINFGNPSHENKPSKTTFEKNIILLVCTLDSFESSSSSLRCVAQLPISLLARMRKQCAVQVRMMLLGRYLI